MSQQANPRLINVLTMISSRYFANKEVIEILENIGDKKVALVSINGRQDKGKSFLMNCLVSYFEYIEREGNTPQTYLELLKYYENRFGSNREEHTYGINIWSKPYQITIKGSKNPVMIFILDTEGCFEDKDSFKNSAIITTLSMAISSIFIFNSFQEVAESQLMIIRLLIKVVQKIWKDSQIFDNSSQKWQKLIFLLRDKSEVFSYLINQPKLEENFDITREEIVKIYKQFSLQKMCQHFEEIHTAKLPFPGLNFTTDREFLPNNFKFTGKNIKFFNGIKCFFENMFNISNQNCLTKDELINCLNETTNSCVVTIGGVIPEMISEKISKSNKQIQALTVYDALTQYFKDKMTKLSKEDDCDIERLTTGNNSCSDMILKIFDKGNFSEDDNDPSILYLKSKLKSETEEIYKGIYKECKTQIQMNDNLRKIKQYEFEIANGDIKHKEQLKSLKSEMEKEYNSLLKQRIFISRKLETDMLYKMDAIPRGLCLIINNIDFNKSYMKRKGAEIDEVKLMDIFKSLNYDIRHENNLSKDEMVNFLTKNRLDCSTAHDALFVIILSHGSKDGLFGTDCLPIAPSEIITLFNNKFCKALVGKPKIFIFIACRGDQLEEGFSYDTLPNPNELELIDQTQISQRIITSTEEDIYAKYNLITEKDYMKEDLKSVYSLPENSDILVTYSAYRNSASWRNTTKGTYMCSVLYETLKDHSNNLDFEAILKRAMTRLYSMIISSGDGKIYVPNLTYELIGFRKYFYFNNYNNN